MKYCGDRMKMIKYMAVVLALCLSGIRCSEIDRTRFRALMNNFDSIFNKDADKYKRYEKMFDDKVDADQKKKREQKLRQKKAKAKRKDRKLTILHDLVSQANKDNKQPERQNRLQSNFQHDGEHNRTHTQTRVIVKNDSDTVIQTSKGSQNQHYQCQDQTGINQVNNHTVNLKNTVNIYNLKSDTYTNKDLDAHVQFRKIKHSDNAPDGDYEEIVIDRDIDESVTSHDLDQGELQENAGLRTEIDDNFTGSNFGKDNGMQILQDGVKVAMQNEENYKNDINVHQHNYINVNHNYLPVNNTQNNVTNVAAAVRTENNVLNDTKVNQKTDVHPFAMPMKAEVQPVVAQTRTPDNSAFNLNKLNQATHDLESLLQQFQENSDQLNDHIDNLKDDSHQDAIPYQSEESAESSEEDSPYLAQDLYEDSPYLIQDQYEDSPYNADDVQLLYPPFVI